MDWIWLLMKLSMVLVWFIGFGCLALFLVHFKPTRKVIERIIGGELELF